MLSVISYGSVQNTTHINAILTFCRSVWMEFLLKW